MSVNPQNFTENEAWILFRLNEAPIETKADGAFQVYAIMDVATGLIHGMEFLPSSSAELSEFEVKKLLNSSRAQAGSLPRQLFVDAARKFGRAKLAAASLGIRLTPEDGASLDSITEEARVGFAARFGTGQGH